MSMPVVSTRIASVFRIPDKLNKGANVRAAPTVLLSVRSDAVVELGTVVSIAQAPNDRSSRRGSLENCAIGNRVEKDAESREAKTAGDGTQPIAAVHARECGAAVNVAVVVPRRRPLAETQIDRSLHADEHGGITDN